MRIDPDGTEIPVTKDQFDKARNRDRPIGPLIGMVTSIAKRMSANGAAVPS